MLLHISIKFTDKDEKFWGIVIKFFLMLDAFAFLTKIESKKNYFLVRRKDVSRIVKQFTHFNEVFLQTLKTSTYYVLRLHGMFFDQIEKKKIVMTWNFKISGGLDTLP